MENLTELKNRIIDYLSALSAFEKAAVVAAHPEKPRAFPLRSPVIAVETAGVELTAAGLGGYLGGDQALYGASALVTLRFGIYHATAEGCGLFYERLCNALLDAAWLGVQKADCERSSYDAKTGAHLLPASAVLKAAWAVPKQEERLFEEFDLKEVRI